MKASALGKCFRRTRWGLSSFPEFQAIVLPHTEEHRSLGHYTAPEQTQKHTERGAEHISAQWHTHRRFSMCLPFYQHYFVVLIRCKLSLCQLNSSWCVVLELCSLKSSRFLVRNTCSEKNKTREIAVVCRFPAGRAECCSARPSCQRFCLGKQVVTASFRVLLKRIPD